MSISVRDVMQVDVATVEAGANIFDVARRMVDRGIGCLPVTRDGALVGIVCRSDVLPFEADPGRSTRIVDQVMATDLVTLSEEMSIAEAARIMARHHIRRAPVMRGATMVGLVSESDLLRPYVRTDTEILTEVEELLGLATFRGYKLRCEVREGAVTLTGVVPGPAPRALLLRTIHAIPGVVGVEDRLSVGEPTIRLDEVTYPS
ncbi:MAG TPA: CBS domain-containing protein [Actinomycetota bacterium]